MSNDAYCIYPCFPKISKFPLFLPNLNISLYFRKILVFCLIDVFCFLPILTMMQLCIRLYSYWAPLAPIASLLTPLALDLEGSYRLSFGYAVALSASLFGCCRNFEITITITYQQRWRVFWLRWCSWSSLSSVDQPQVHWQSLPATSPGMESQRALRSSRNKIVFEWKLILP